MAGGVSQLLKGRGDGTFSAVHPRRSGLVAAGDAKSLCRCDINGDGWPDFVVGNNDAQPQAFIHQGANPGQSLVVNLRGKPGNRQAVGALVQLRSGNHTNSQEIQLGSGYLSQSDTRVFFGATATGQRRELTIRWPDGTKQTREIAANETHLTIDQSPD